MITVFGSINLDLIFALDRLPRPGETLLGPATRIEPGGKGANQAAAAALDRGAALPAALRRASIAAGLCCTRSGSQGSLPRARDTDVAASEG